MLALIAHMSAWHPTNRGIPSGEMSAGRKVAVAALDDANPSDMVIVAVWT